MMREYLNKEAGYWMFWTSKNYTADNLPMDFVRDVLGFFAKNNFVVHKDNFTLTSYNDRDSISSDIKINYQKFLENPNELNGIGENDTVYSVFHVNGFVNLNQTTKNEDALRIDFRFLKDQYDIQITCTDCLLPIRKLSNNLEVSNWEIYKLNKFRLRDFLSSLNDLPFWEEDYSRPKVIDRSEYGCLLTGTDMFLPYKKVSAVLEDPEDGDSNFDLKEYQKDYPMENYGISEDQF